MGVRLAWVSASLAVLVCAGCGQAQGPLQGSADFERQDVTGLRTTGDVKVVTDRAHGGQGSLAIARGGEATFALAEQGGCGTLSLWVYESGSRREGAAATEYAFGPMWGLTNARGQVLVVGQVFAPFLDGNGHYAWVSTAANGWFDRWDTGIARAEGWHQWEFSIAPDNTIRITMDGAAEATGFRAATAKFDTGLTGLYVRGSVDTDEILYVDDVAMELTQTQPVTPLRQMPRMAWPIPSQHPVPADAAWTHGPWQDPGFFPIGVWLQAPSNAERFRDVGINLYIGLWEGPTEEQLSALAAAGMPVLCDQNETALAHRTDPTIVGWLQGDEPDNAQPVTDPATGQQGYGPPVPPLEVVRRYEAMRAADPTRPVLLNLGQGLANEAWIGRGSEGKPEDYDTYVNGGDIVSFDIYPATNTGLPDGGHELWYVAKGLDRLRALTGDNKTIWSVLECTHIGEASLLPTPAEIRAQAWVSIIHGATGLVWFVHEFAPEFVEAGLFEHPENVEAVAAVNGEIQGLARVLHSPTRSDLATAVSAREDVPVDVLCKQYEGATYVFAVAMQGAPTTARFTVEGLTGTATAEVLGEDREITVTDGAFDDAFDGWGVHLYRIAAR